MRHHRTLAAVALLITVASAPARHYGYEVNLTGTYTVGGPQGCTPADQTGCPQPGAMLGSVSFDTPSDGDGSWLIESNYGDITDFLVTVGSLPTDTLYGDINVVDGAPNGSVQALDQSETFTFDWATRSAEYSYGFPAPSPNGNFTGTLTAVPEPATGVLLLAGLAGLVGARRRRASAAA